MMKRKMHQRQHLQFNFVFKVLSFKDRIENLRVVKTPNKKHRVIQIITSAVPKIYQFDILTY